MAISTGQVAQVDQAHTGSPPSGWESVRTACCFEIADVAALRTCIVPRHSAWLVHITEEVETRLVLVEVGNDLR